MGQIVSLIESVDFFLFTPGIRWTRCVELPWKSYRDFRVLSGIIIARAIVPGALCRARTNKRVNCEYRNNIRRREIRFRFSIS